MQLRTACSTPNACAKKSRQACEEAGFGARLVSLDVSDVSETAAGLLIRVRGFKTYPGGIGDPEWRAAIGAATKRMRDEINRERQRPQLGANPGLL